MKETGKNGYRHDLGLEKMFKRDEKYDGELIDLGFKKRSRQLEERVQKERVLLTHALNFLNKSGYPDGKYALNSVIGGIERSDLKDFENLGYVKSNPYKNEADQEELTKAALNLKVYAEEKLEEKNMEPISIPSFLIDTEKSDLPPRMESLIRYRKNQP